MAVEHKDHFLSLEIYKIVLGHFLRISQNFFIATNFPKKFIYFPRLFKPFAEPYLIFEGKFLFGAPSSLFSSK